MSFKEVVKRWWMYKHGYVSLIHRMKTNDGTEYIETVDLIKKSELPPMAKRIQNYGKNWYYYDSVTPGMDQTPDIETMTARDICTWADNNDLNKALTELWSWTNNIDIKKIVMIVGVVIVGFVIYTMVR